MGAEQAQAAVLTAAFWKSIADFAKTMQEAAKGEAVALCGADEREKTTGKNPDGQPMGVLRKDPDKSEWSVTDRAALIEYLDRAYPGTVERRQVTTTEVTVPGTVVSRLLADMAAKGCDLLTGESVPGVGLTTRPGNWVLTTTKDAKQATAEVFTAMVEERALPIPEAFRALISGGE